MQTYDPEVGDSVVCNPDFPEEIFQACGLPTNQKYKVVSVHSSPDERDTYINVLGEDGKVYENFGPTFFIKKVLH